MLAAAVTLVLFSGVISMFIKALRHDGAKIAAALEGRSWAADSSTARPVTIRFNPRRTEVTLEPHWQPGLRAAA